MKIYGDQGTFGRKLGRARMPLGMMRRGATPRVFQATTIGRDQWGDRYRRDPVSFTSTTDANNVDRAATQSSGGPNAN